MTTIRLPLPVITILLNACISLIELDGNWSVTLIVTISNQNNLIILKLDVLFSSTRLLHMPVPVRICSRGTYGFS